MPSPLARVYANPGDDELRAVVADELQQKGDPRGEFITAQLAIANGTATPAIRKRARELVDDNLAAFVGPLVKVASLLAKKKCLEFERGFLSRVRLDRRSVQRADWDKAAKAQEWATVTEVELSVLTTPIWWIEKWAKNAAAKRSLLKFSFTVCQLERSAADLPWTITRIEPRTVYHSALAAFLSPAEKKTVTFGKVAKKHREMAEQTLGRAGR
ncbi:MAG: TIGR02996 domain-containing protein [Kofleriaceae bacterium]